MARKKQELSPEAQGSADEQEEARRGFDAAEEQEPGEAAEQIDEMPEAELSLGTLKGDLRDAIIGQIRTMARTWDAMTEDQQRGVANIVEMAAGNLVRQTVRLITAHEFPHAVVRLGDVKIMGGDKGIEAKITCSNIEVNRTALGEHVGDLVTLLMIDSEQFMNERRPAQVDPDQGDMLPDEAA